VAASATPRPGGAGAPSRRAGRRRREPPPPLLTEANALFLDVDGTLVHLADAPNQVKVESEVQALLPALAGKLGGALALITGRSIDDVDRLFHGITLPVAGQHGCERRSADGSIQTHAGLLPGLPRVRRTLALFAQEHTGVLFEDKGSTFALHYRLAPGLGGLVDRIVRAQLAELEDGAWTLQRGKFVVELRPDGRDKGTAILEFLEEPPFRGRVPVFVGDDLTDEYGFSAVASGGGWAVKVGQGPTVARHRLAGVPAVREWLQAAVTGAAAEREVPGTP